MEKNTMPVLSRKYVDGLPDNTLGRSVKEMFGLPEKVLQFGTGVLLRGLPDYFIDKANREGIFNGRIVVVKSTETGAIDPFSQQDFLYTICVRGEARGSNIEENVVSSSISRVLSAKNEWQKVLACASNPDMKIIISNTTEVGIELVRESIFSHPPVSFPGKLLAFLYQRYRAFEGNEDCGMVVVPTELITDNGKKLQHIVLELAHLNGLEARFIDWLEKHNHFCNSLVDRIVPGVPQEAVKIRIEEELGYRDQLITVCEVYRLWAIEGSDHIKMVLSFHGVDEGMVIAPSIETFRELKLRLLNGSHTLSCGLAFLCGINTVKEAMEHPVLSVFIQNLMLCDIASGIASSLDQKEIFRFGESTLERFRNPHVAHYWINITAQYTSKMYMRNIPTLLNYVSVSNSSPEYICFGFAAYLLFMKAIKYEDSRYWGMCSEKFYVINDSKAAYFYEKWNSLPLDAFIVEVLKNNILWETDLTLLPHFELTVLHWLRMMLEKGGMFALESFMKDKMIAR